MIFLGNPMRVSIPLLLLCAGIRAAPSPLNQASVSIEARADGQSPAPSITPNDENSGRTCEEHAQLRAYKDDCVNALKLVPYSDRAGYFHHGDPLDDFVLPDHGWVYGNCKLYPHLIDPETRDRSSWEEVKTALVKIVVRCAKGDGEGWGDITTGGTAAVGDSRSIIVDVRNLDIGSANGTSQMGGSDGVAVAR